MSRFFLLFLAFCLSAGCLQFGQATETGPRAFVAFSVTGEMGSIGLEDLVTTTMATTGPPMTVPTPSGSNGLAHPIVVTSASNPQTKVVFLDVDTLEAVAIREGGSFAIPSPPTSVLITEIMVLAPFHLISSESGNVSFMGMSATWTTTAQGGVLAFDVETNGTKAIVWVFSYVFFEGTSLPKTLSYRVETHGNRQAERYLWRATEVSLAETIAHAAEGETRFTPRPVSAWSGMPAIGGYTPFSPEVALTRARTNDQIAGFFADNEDAFLGHAQYFDESTGVATDPAIAVEISRNWIMEWWAPGTTIRFSVRWETPTLPSNLPTYTTMVLGTEQNIASPDWGQWRPNMLTWGDAFSMCRGDNATDLGVGLLFTDDVRFSGAPADLVLVGGMPLMPRASYGCTANGRAFSVDAYTGLLIGA